MKEGLNRRTVGTEDLLHQRDPGSLQDEKVHGKITLWTKLLTTRKLYKAKLAMRSLSCIFRFSLLVWTDVGWTRISVGLENMEKKLWVLINIPVHVDGNFKLYQIVSYQKNFARTTRLSCVQLLKFCYFC